MTFPTLTFYPRGSPVCLRLPLLYPPTPPASSSALTALTATEIRVTVFFQPLGWYVPRCGPGDVYVEPCLQPPQIRQRRARRVQHRLPPPRFVLCLGPLSPGVVRLCLKHIQVNGIQGEEGRRREKEGEGGVAHCRVDNLFMVVWITYLIIAVVCHVDLYVCCFSSRSFLVSKRGSLLLPSPLLLPSFCRLPAVFFLPSV